MTFLLLLERRSPVDLVSKYTLIALEGKNAIKYFIFIQNNRVLL